MASPGVWVWGWKPLVGLRVVDDAGPEPVSFQLVMLFGGIWMFDWGCERSMDCLLASSSCFRNASSRLISSSIRLSKRYRRTHLPKLTGRNQQSTRHQRYIIKLTSLVFFEVNLLFNFQLVRVHFGVKACVFFQDTSQTACSCIDRAPMSHRIHSIDFLQHIVEMALAE